MPFALDRHGRSEGHVFAAGDSENSDPEQTPVADAVVMCERVRGALAPGAFASGIVRPLVDIPRAPGAGQS